MKEKIQQKLKGVTLEIDSLGTSYKTFFRVGQYSNGRIALELITDDKYQECFAVLTVNLPEIKIGENNIIVKTWSENKNVAKAALASGKFIDTGKRIPTGFVEASIWEVK